VALIFTSLNPSVAAVNGAINVSALGANAEISAFNPASGYLYTVGGGSGAIVVSDLRNPAAPVAVAKATPADSSQTLQSAAVYGKLLAVAVQNSVKTDNGFVQFYDLTNPELPVHISTVTVGALPDMVKFSSDGKKLLLTNEGEPNSDYTIDPVGSISLIDTSGYLATTPVVPGQPQVQTVDFSAWNNRKAELSNRGIRITGKAGVTTTLAQDIEPEAIAITADGNTAYVSLQENNAIAVLDISTTTPKITSIFSAGIQDWDRGTASAQNYSYTLSYAAGNQNLPSGVQAGGLSGLFFAGTETVGSATRDIYYSVTDRGPNGALFEGKRQFLDPDFQPTIYKLGMDRATGAVTELGKIGLKRADGTALTGLPQLQGKDDIPIDTANQNLAYDPFGIDSETVSVFTATIGGTSRKVFAVGDEYRGQISIFDFTTGNLIQRFIPAGQKAQLQAQHGNVIGAETIDSLPAIYGTRQSNRGIEGMAFNSKDGLLYAFVQSPMDVDSNGDGVAERSLSQITRILAIDPATGTPVKEHLYQLSGRAGQDKIGDVAYDAARNVFLVMERDSSRTLNGFKSVYEVDLRGATNTLPLTLGTQVSETALPAQTFLVGTEGRAVFREVIDAGEQGNNGYRFNGIPDGIGVTDNGDGTLRVLVTHELRDTAGDVRAHGSKGAYVSDLTIDKATLSVLSGKDFLSSADNLFLASADGTSWTSGATTAFNRFCSADLAAATAFRNGTTGYAGRIFLSGEESGAEGRAFAHVLDGSDAGKVYEVPSLGNLSFENVVANPLAQNKTVVASLDDTSTNGQVYVYVGNKATTGNAIQQAGLAGGITYGVRVNSTGTTNTEVGDLASPNATGLGLTNGVGTFELVNLGDVKAKTGATLNSESITAGVTNWLRPEDGAWSKDGKSFYFVTTASTTAPNNASRLWALEFTNPANPELGGTVKMLLNGSEGQVMLDNMTVADDGSILLQEDPGTNSRLAKIWRYNPSTDTLVELAQHNPALFSGTVSGTGNVTIDEESSGIVDISSYLTGVSGYDTTKYSYFLIADQIHKAVATPTSQVEMGELSVMATAKADAKQQIVPETALPAQTFLVGTEGRAVFREVIDAGEQGNNGYRFNGIPDGIGVTDNGDGTLRVLVTHELRDTAGDVRAHGSKGAYVSDLTIDKATLSVLSGKDFLSSADNLFLASADGTSWTSGATTAFNRFCSADLAAATAFRNGTTGYAGRIFLSGEESGAEGRAFAHVLDGSDAGKVYEVPSLGNLSFENVVANPLAQNKTVVASLDDTSTNGQVYVYVGNKATTGNAIQQAGLAGGITYGVRVNSTGTTNTEVGDLASPNATGLGLTNGVGTFELVNLGDVKAKTGATLNSESITAGVTNWLRPEDGAWSKDGKSFYFVTTASTTAPNNASRLWALEFTNPANPELGGTVKMLLNGSEGQVMLDNMTVADDGSILLQEDPGTNSRLAKIWRYNPSTDTLVELAQHNPALFSGTVSGTGNVTIDEESSGIVDISSYLTGVSGYDTTKYSYFLIADQIHKAVATPTSQVEMGELSVMVTAKASPAGTATWADAIGVASPELLDNRLTLVNGVYAASSADRLSAAGIKLVNKVELFNLPSVGGSLAYDKPEGLTLRDDGSIVINYDNDFGTEGANGNAFTVVNFSNPALDTENAATSGVTGYVAGYQPATNHDVYGLVMPDGLATITYNSETFILAAGEGDDRNDFLAPDETSIVSTLLTAAASATAAQKAGLLATNAQRLNIFTNTGDLDGDGIVDQAYALGSRSLRIFDSKGNVVFDSGAALEELANSKGIYPINSREDDKGVEPEMVEVFNFNGRTYAFVGLERTTTSMAAIFDVSNPYAPVAVEPVIFPGAQRVEGITFLTTANEFPRLIATSEGNDTVSVSSITTPGPVIRKIGEVTALIPEASTANDLSERLDGQSGDTDFPYASFKALATVGEVDPVTNKALTGYPDGNAAWLKDNDTIRVAYQSESYATMSNETYGWEMESGVKFTGSHIHYIDYDRSKFASFLDNDESASMMFEGSGHLFDKVYNVFGKEVDNKTTSSIDLAGKWGNQTKPDGTLIEFTPTRALTEGDFFFHSFCGSWYEQANKYGTGIGMADDVWFMAEEWNIGERMFADPDGAGPLKGFDVANTTMGLASMVVDIKNEVAYTVPALGQSGYEKLMPMNSGHKDYVVVVASGYNHDINPAPMKVYVGRKGLDASGNVVDQASVNFSERDKFLARNGLLYGQLYGMAANASTYSQLGITSVNADSQMLDSYLTNAGAPSNFSARYYPTDFRWNGFDTPEAVIDTEVLRWAQDGDNVNNVAEPNKQPVGYTYFNSNTKVEHPAVDPDPTKFRYVQNHTNAGALLGVEFTNMIGDLTQNDLDNNKLPDFLSADVTRILAGVNGALTVDVADKGVGHYNATGNPSGATAAQHIEAKKYQMVAPDGLLWARSSDANVLIVDEDSGNDYGERKFALLIDETTLDVEPSATGYFLAQAGGNKNPRALAGASAYGGTYEVSSGSEFSGSWNVTALVAKKEDGTFYTQSELTGGAVQAIEQSLPLAEHTFIGVVQQPGESAGAVESTKSDYGGQLFMFNMDLPIPPRYTLQLLHIADGEAGLLASQTAPYLAGLVDGYDNTYANTLILAGGDNFIPSPFLNGGTDFSVRDELNAVTGSTISYAAGTNHPIGAVDIAIHNLLGVEASTIGNHEFDLGSRVFRDTFTPASGWVGAQFPYLSANLDFSGDADLSSRFTNTAATAGLEEAASQKGKIVPSAVVTKNGEKIGLVGATTQVIEQISSTGGVEVKGFTGDGSERDDMALLASQLQPVIDDLISQGVNKVILMSHLQQIGNEKALAPLLRGVDIILAAGSNTRLGDGNDQAVAFPGHGPDFADTYPLLTQGKDGNATLIVNTDNEYTYLGRLVVDFDAQGHIIPSSVDPLVSGAYAATAANVAKAWNVTEAQLPTTAFAEGTKAENVQDLTDAVQSVINVKDGQVWGFSSVYLEGERALVRGQETNLGNLTADANLAYARKIDPTVVLSLKNGGGIRSQIGSIDVVTGAKEATEANASAGKPEGGVSTLDIENSLRFNNTLSLVTVSVTKLKELLEHGIALGAGQGRFPQVSGVQFSYDLSKAAGSRILNLVIQDSKGNDLDVLVRDGIPVGDQARSFRMVTLNFLAAGGDGYPFPTDAVQNVAGPSNRVDLFKADAALTGAARFAGDGTEQDALAEYLKANYGTASLAYNRADTPASQDLRLLNLALRSNPAISLEQVTLDASLAPSLVFNPGRPVKFDASGFGLGSAYAVLDSRSNGSILEQLSSGIDLNLSTTDRVSVLRPAGGLTIDAGANGLLDLSPSSDTITNLGGQGNTVTGGIGPDVFEINEQEPAVSGIRNDVIRDFQVGLDQLVVNTASGQKVFDRNTEVSELRGNPQLAGVSLQLTPYLRASASRLHAISGQTSLLGAGLRLAQTDASIRQAEIDVKGGSTLQLDLTQVPAGMQAQILSGGARIVITASTTGAALDPSKLQAALGAIRFQGSSNGSVEVRAIDAAGLVATTTERPFTLVAPTAVSTLRPSVVRLDAAGGDLALQGVQLKPLQVHGGAGEDAVRLSSSVEGRQSAYGFAGADVLSAPQGGRLLGGGDVDVLIGSSTALANLSGGAGNDTLVGGVNNVLAGGSGDDLLVALGGGNVLQGGAGADRFVLADGAWRGGAANVVTDFQPRVDKLVFGGGALVGSNQPVFTNVAGGTKVELGTAHLATLVGVSSSQLNSSLDVIGQSGSLVSPLANRYSDVAVLQLAVNSLV